MKVILAKSRILDIQEDKYCGFFNKSVALKKKRFAIE